MNGLKVVKRGIRWRVGNGNLIHIWEDKWLPTPSTYKVSSPKSSLVTSQCCPHLLIRILEDGKLIWLDPCSSLLRQTQY